MIDPRKTIVVTGVGVVSPYGIGIGLPAGGNAGGQELSGADEGSVSRIRGNTAQVGKSAAGGEAKILTDIRGAIGWRWWRLRMR